MQQLVDYFTHLQKNPRRETIIDEGNDLDRAIDKAVKLTKLDAAHGARLRVLVKKMMQYGLRRSAITDQMVALRDMANTINDDLRGINADLKKIYRPIPTQELQPIQ
jgi:hypothetical protein